MGSVCAKSKVNKKGPDLARLCSSNAEPSSTRSGASSGLSGRVAPNTLDAGPTRVCDRVGKAGPGSRRSRAGGELPGHAKLRRNSAEPNCARSGADSSNPNRPVEKRAVEESSVTRLRAEGMDPQHEPPNAEKARSSHARLFSSRGGSRCRRSGTDVVEPEQQELCADKLKPILTKSRARTEAPGLAQLLTSMASPASTRSRSGTVAPEQASPEAGSTGSSQAKDRRGAVNPGCKKSGADDTAPGCPKLRKRMEEPGSAKSDRKGDASVRAAPEADGAKSKHAELRTNKEMSGCRKSKAKTETSQQARLRTSINKPVCTKSSAGELEAIHVIPEVNTAKSGCAGDRSVGEEPSSVESGAGITKPRQAGLCIGSAGSEQVQSSAGGGELILAWPKIKEAKPERA